MHRARSLALVAVLALVWSSWPAATAWAVPTRQSDMPIDLAALAVYPSDTGDDGYVLIDGKSCFTAEACANPIFFGAATEASLTEVGLTQAYAVALAKFSEDGNSLTRTLATTLAEYDDRAGAEQGMTTFLSWLADPASEEEVSSKIGDEAQLFDIGGPLPADPSSTGVVGLRFRVGSLVVGIEIRDYTGTAPNRADLEKLARKVAQRIKTEQSAAEPGLGALVVHHRATATEFYPHRGSNTVRLLQENADQFDARATEFGAAGIEDVFLSNQALVAGDDPQQTDILLSIAAYRLPSNSEASAYLYAASTAFAAERERIGAPIDEPEEPPIIGDESVWYLNVYTDAYQAMGYVRVGNVVARVIWQRNQPTPAGEEATLLRAAEQELLPGAQYSAEAQVRCLEDGGCPGLTRLPSRLLP